MIATGAHEQVDIIQHFQYNLKVFITSAKVVLLSVPHGYRSTDKLNRIEASSSERLGAPTIRTTVQNCVSKRNFYCFQVLPEVWTRVT